MDAEVRVIKRMTAEAVGGSVSTGLACEKLSVRRGTIVLKPGMGWVRGVGLVQRPYERVQRLRLPAGANTRIEQAVWRFAYVWLLRTFAGIHFMQLTGSA